LIVLVYVIVFALIREKQLTASNLERPTL